jgi:hypothetical protein
VVFFGNTLSLLVPQLMKITQGKIATVRSGEVEFISEEFEAVHLSDPERACLSE